MWTTLSKLKKTKNSIMTQDFEKCYCCPNDAQQCHHIFGGADKQLSEDLGLLIPICNDCHRYIHDVDGGRRLKEEAQRKYLEQELNCDFGIQIEEDECRNFIIEIFGRCYL